MKKRDALKPMAGEAGMFRGFGLPLAALFWVAIVLLGDGTTVY